MIDFIGNDIEKNTLYKNEIHHLKNKPGQKMPVPGN